MNENLPERQSKTSISHRLGGNALTTLVSIKIVIKEVIRLIFIILEKDI
jgi:hypothetical protein